MKIGHITLKNNVIVAPMAGVTDRPFRMLAKRMGAGLAVSEMVTSIPSLWKSDKTVRRGNHEGEPGPISVQIAGADPEMMADAARYNVDKGAEIIDINMGCPAKKVCNVAAGSALMRDEALVKRILEAVVNAVDVPVTMKFRTGWDKDNKNAVAIAKIAESSGIQSLAVHGRTRACGYSGEAEYDTIAAVKQAVGLPVIANGDITSAEKAAKVLAYTKADGIMIGRAAQGKPWIFNELVEYLATGKLPPAPTYSDIRAIVLSHLTDLYGFYGEHQGCLISRKHIGWYVKQLPGGEDFRQAMNQLKTAEAQFEAVNHYFDLLLASPQHPQ
ncbi:tRNA dihydrouridine synthase DusB [Leeia sp. TBRC 13508]|uniref:tRNA-dihydrouridine synthase B n=1 Tax=Leeia speluncae TaxID=2884804 RepID=A0ABS8D732_9NEIS|nr:tRNA dihydrouridine synthase DusB [Leeia speluncae]MCB6184005.1 tRNA dihydrouridine synthase DusB [Leeia speluncae]